MRRRLSALAGLAAATAAAAVLFSAPAAVAKLSLAQRKQAKQWDAELAETLAHLNDKCGTKVKASVDWDTFDNEAGRQALSGRWSVSGYCAPPLNVLRWQCEKDAFGKQAAATIKQITCRFAPQGKRSITLNKGEVVFGADLGAANADDFVKAAYLDQLKLAEQRSIAYEDQQLAKELKWTNKTCGTSLKATIDWESFKKATFLTSRYSVHGYCDGVLTGLERVCSDVDGKEAVQRSVKRVVCQHSGKSKVQALSLTKGTLTWTMSWDGANAGDVTQAWLLNNL